MIIGICGGSGSGKTTLMNQLVEEFQTLNPTKFSLDNYYLPLASQQKDANGIVNFDVPTALDFQKLKNDLIQLKSGQPITVQEYNFNLQDSPRNEIKIVPSPLIIVEGLFLFYYEEIRDLLDFRIFIHVDLEEQLQRRLRRDQLTRGYTAESIVYQWKNHVLPAFEKYIQPFEIYADFIYSNIQDTTAELQQLKNVLLPKIHTFTLQ